MNALVVTLVLLLLFALRTSAVLVQQEQKISAGIGNLQGNLNKGDRFGRSVAEIGDLNRDGVRDIAVGAEHDNDGGFRRGAVYILFLNEDGTVKNEQKISSIEGNFTGVLMNNSCFGSAVSSLGDMDADGVTDVVVGASHKSIPADGVLWILFLRTDGTVKNQRKIQSTDEKFHSYKSLGTSVSALGDLDNDNVTDIAVGAPLEQDGCGTHCGAVYVLFLNADGSVKETQKISSSEGNFSGILKPEDRFGNALSMLGDVDRDGITDLAVGAWFDDGYNGSSYGAVWILFLNTNGTAKGEQKIGADGQGNFRGPLSDRDHFGSGVSSLGDLNGDLIPDMVIGADGHQVGRGAVWVLLLNADGTVLEEQKISDRQGNFTGVLTWDSWFGIAICPLGDLNNDGFSDMAVGAYNDNADGSRVGSVWVIFLEQIGSTSALTTSVSTAAQSGMALSTSMLSTTVLSSSSGYTSSTGMFSTNFPTALPSSSGSASSNLLSLSSSTAAERALVIVIATVAAIMVIGTVAVIVIFRRHRRADSSDVLRTELASSRISDQTLAEPFPAVLKSGKLSDTDTALDRSGLPNPAGLKSSKRSGIDSPVYNTLDGDGSPIFDALDGSGSPIYNNLDGSGSPIYNTLDGSGSPIYNTH